jgi:hypothetical protein
MNTTANDLTDLATMHQQLIGNNGFLDMSGGTAGINSPPSIPTFIRRPWLDPGDGATPFDAQGGVALPAAPSVDTTVLTFTVDIGYDGVINSLSQNFTGSGFVQFSGDIIWRLLINGKPVRNFSNMTAEKGTIVTQRQISPIRLFSGDVVTYVVNHANNNALNGNVVCSITGYTYPNRGT